MFAAIHAFLRLVKIRIKNAGHFFFTKFIRKFFKRTKTAIFFFILRVNIAFLLQKRCQIFFPKPRPVKKNSVHFVSRQIILDFFTKQNHPANFLKTAVFEKIRRLDGLNRFGKNFRPFHSVVRRSCTLNPANRLLHFLAARKHILKNTARPQIFNRMTDKLHNRIVKTIFPGAVSNSSVGRNVPPDVSININHAPHI